MVLAEASLSNTSAPLAFILYRQHHQASVVAQNPGLANPEISKVIGDHWRASAPEVKDHWKSLAEVGFSELCRRIPRAVLILNVGGKASPSEAVSGLSLPTSPLGSLEQSTGHQ